MTDNEIIQALEKNLKLMLYEGDLQRASTISEALDLIKRQQAEIERLQADLTRVCAERDARICTNNFIRAEAIKEFAERLKAIVIYIPWCDYPPIHREINNLVKEMVGEDNAAD